MKLKLRSSARFLASIFDGVGTSVRKDGLATYVDLDYGSLEPVTSFDPSTKQIAVSDSVSGIWNKTTLSSLLALSGYAATSLTTATIASSPITFATQAGLAYRPGARARASYTGDTSKYVEGLVTDYTATNLTISVSKTNGSGTFSSWNLNIAGDPGSGDMLSTNNLNDVASKPTSLNNLSGVSWGAVQSLTPAQMLQARQNIGTGARGVINILDYGGVGDDTTLCDAAFALAWAALNASGCGCIYFPAGVYRFNNAITKTLLGTTGCVKIIGDGPKITQLHFTGATNGIAITQGDFRSNIVLEGFSVTTARPGTNGIGILLTGPYVAVATTSWSYVCNVMVHGDDYTSSGGYQNYWSVSIKVHVWSQFSFVNVNTYGKVSASGGGTGIIFEGDVATSSYGILYNFQQCSFNYHVFGAIYGDFIQGVTFNQCNFNGRSSGVAMITGGSYVGILSQLAISNCQFDYGNGSISLSTGIFDFMCSNNIFSISLSNAVAVNLPQAVHFTMVGNKFYNYNAATYVNTTGLFAGGSGTCGTISGNSFVGLALGYNLGVGTNNISAVGNAFLNTTTKYINSGSSQTPGIAETAHTMP